MSCSFKGKFDAESQNFAINLNAPEFTSASINIDIPPKIAQDLAKRISLCLSEDQQVSVLDFEKKVMTLIEYLSLNIKIDIINLTQTFLRFLQTNPQTS